MMEVAAKRSCTWMLLLFAHIMLVYYCLCRDISMYISIYHRGVSWDS